MPMKLISIGVSFLLGILDFSAQETKTLWQKDIESSTQEILSGLTTTLDGQYLLSGSSINTKPQKLSTDNSQANNGYDYHILKLDQKGGKVWEKYFSGNKNDYLNTSVSTQEGGFLLAGSSYSSQSGDKKEISFGSSDMWIIKVDENGEEEWQRTIGTKYSEDAYSAVQTTDLGYVIAGGISGAKFGYGSKDAIITKLDKEGKILYQLILGGNNNDQVEKIIPTKDGGCLIGIYSQSSTGTLEEKESIPSKEFLNTYSIPSKNSDNTSEDYEVSFYQKQTPNYGIGDYWLVKLDKNGKVQWEKNYGGEEDDHIRTLAFTDNGYIVGGESRSKPSGNKEAGIKEGTDLWLISLDENGEQQWQTSYDFSTRDILMSLNTIKDKDDKNKGYLIGGYSQAEGKTKKDDETFWMMYVNAEGKEQWRKLVEGKDKRKEERLVSALMNRDGSYVLAGTSAEQLGEQNWKIVKLGSKQLEDLIEKQDIRIYPNPVEDYCYVEIGLEIEKGQQFEVYVHDMSGKMVQTIKTTNQVTKINTSSLPQGVYIVTATTPTKSVNAKIVKK